MQRKGTRSRYFVQRIPKGVQPQALGMKLSVPIGGATQAITVTPAMAKGSLRISLRTDDPVTAKIRQAEIVAYLEAIWRSLREDAPVSLTAKQATALAGLLYLAWANEEENDRTVSGTIGFDGTWTPEPPPLPHEMAAAWENLREKLSALPADDTEALEAVLGSIVDRLLLAHGIRRVDSHSRLILLGAFRDALRDAAASRQRQAEGDYSPDPKAQRFPAWQPSGEPSKPVTVGDNGKLTLGNIVEGWWAEAKAVGVTQSTYEAYSRKMERLKEFLGHDDAARVTADNIVAFKNKRLADGINARTVKDNDLSALRALFGWAVTNRKLQVNPAVGITLRPAKTVRTRARDFTEEEARAILKHAADYRKGPREDAKTAAAKRWVPWLCAYTGARVGEIVQLRKTDLRKVSLAAGRTPEDRAGSGEVWVLTITPEAYTVKDKEFREVVLHSHLVDLGFPDFVASAKAGHLFITPDANGELRGSWRTMKNRVTESVRKAVTDPRVRPNHAWRHTFKTIGRQAGIEDSVLDAICGHAPGSIGADYGEVTVAAKARAFERFPRFTV
ncbi:site-specific integrase [Labrys sp. La1]|uniref:site-specific integrase n=1 Tax=Labrys sp. La1 TaxID=3404917 RepID=UPI003EBE4C1E